MRKYISAIVVFVYLLMLFPQTFALSEIDGADINEIPAISYDEEGSSSDISVDSSDSERIIIGDGQYVTYKVNFAKSGYYKLLCYGKHTGEKPDITISGDAENPLYGLGVSKDADQRNTIGRCYFSQGEKDLKISVTGGEINVSAFFLKCVEHEIESTGVNLIEAHDYLEANITSPYNEDAQWSYNAIGAPCNVQGPIIAGTDTSLRRSTTYRLNVKESGLYRLSVTARSAYDADYTLEMGNEVYSEAKMSGDGSGSVCQTAVFETFNLSEGVQDITIYCRPLSEVDNAGHIFTFYYILERIENVKEAGIIKEEETIFSAGDIILEDEGVEISDDSVKLSPDAKAFFYLDFDTDSFSALYVTYKAENETNLKLYFGTDVEFDGLIAPAPDNANKQLLILKNSGEGLVRAYFTSNSEIEIESIICCKISDENLSDAISQVDLAKDENMLKVALSNLKEYGMDTDGMFSGIIYKTPVYMRIINDDFNNAEDFICKLKSHIESERVRPWVKFHADGERIYDLKNCEISEEYVGYEGYKIEKLPSDIDEANSKGFTKYSTSVGVTTTGEVVWSITPDYTGIYELVFNYGVGGEEGTSLSGVTAFVNDAVVGTYSKESSGNWLNASDTVFGTVTLYAGQTYVVKFKNSGVTALVRSMTVNWAGEYSSEITAVLESSYLKDNQTVLAALYQGNKLYKVDVKFYENQESISFNFGNTKIKKGEEYNIKLFYLNSISGLIPINVFPEIYSEIYVSQEGNDETGDGTYASPFKSLKRAMDEVALINDNQWGDIIVHVESGIYELSETLLLNEEHSGKNGFYVRVCGDEENTTVLSGGKKVTEWKESANGLWYAELKDIEYVRNLYINDYPAVRARTDMCFEAGKIVADEDSTYAKDGIEVANEDMPYSFETPEDIELVWNYVFNSCRTSVTDITQGDVCDNFYLNRETLNYSSAYFKQGDIFYIENAMELLDERGEFYYNKNESTIYYYPYEWEDMTNAESYVAETELLIDISGESKDEKVKNLSFEKLAFKYGAYNFASEVGYIGEQADSLTTTLTDDKGRRVHAAQFTVNNADNISVENCEFSCLGSSAIHFVDSVTNSEICGNLIRDISGTGIVIGTPLHHVRTSGVEVCRNINISNNLLRRTSSEFFNNTAISIYYEKNIDVTHNDIDNVPYTGITAGWGWEGSDPYDCGNINISCNKITNVMQSLSDGGGIYTLGTLKGSTISGNYLKGHPAKQGGMIYADAGSAFIEVYDNVILETKLSLHIQNVRYRNRHLNFYNNYSDKNTINDYGESDSIVAEDLIILDDGEWPQKASEIMLASGLEEEYGHLIQNDNFGERKLRFDYPQNTKESPIIPVEDAISEKSDFDVITEADGDAAVLSANQYITINVFAEKEGYHKVIIYGRRDGSEKVVIDADKEGVKGLGISAEEDCRYTIGRYYLEKGDNEIKLSVSSGKAVLKEIYIKNVMHNVKAIGENLIEMHDYYKANISSVYNEDHQWRYKASNTAFAATGPVIAANDSPRTVVFKMNTEIAGSYKLKLYSSSGEVETSYSVLDESGVLATKDITESNHSTPLACEEISFDTFNLPAGETELSIKCSPKNGHVYMYYFVLERVLEN